MKEPRRTVAGGTTRKAALAKSRKNIRLEGHLSSPHWDEFESREARLFSAIDEQSNRRFLPWTQRGTCRYPNLRWPFQWRRALRLSYPQRATHGLPMRRRWRFQELWFQSVSFYLVLSKSGAT